MFSSPFVCCVFILVTKIYAVDGDDKPRNLGEATAEFALNILKQTEPKENVFFSPFSISTCIGMVYLGAANNTKKELNQVVYANLSDSAIFIGLKTSLDKLSVLPPGYNLSVANKAYVSDRFELSDIVKLKLFYHFKTDITNVNFNNSEQVREMINEWVTNNTGNMIKDLLQIGSISEETRFILVNAIYFKGNWMTVFDKTLTKKSKFETTSKDNFEIEMMNADAKHNEFRFYANGDCEILGILFKNETVIMYFILPTVRFGLENLVSILNGNKLLGLLDLTQHLVLADGDLTVKIPKFKMTKGLPLMKILQELSIKDLFGEDADLSRFFLPPDNRMLYVTGAYHQAAVEVNEEGAGASAATAIVAGDKGGPRSLKFIADHPFLFAIYHTTAKALLFLGRFYDDKYAGNGDDQPRDLGEATAEFALKILKQTESKENAFFSPFSISTCIGMLYLGAAKNTKKELNQVVYANLSDSAIFIGLKTSLDELSVLPPGYNLSVANKAYVSDQFELSDIVKLKLFYHFKTDITNVNFDDFEQVREIINQWVTNNTGNMIKDLLPGGSISKKTRFVLVNAIYFKGNWMKVFDKTLTKKSKFETTSKDNFEIEMMNAKHKEFHFFENDDCQVLGISFKNETVIMYFILPTERFGLEKLVDKLNGNKLLDLIEKAQPPERDDVTVKIPKFKMTKGLPLKDILLDLSIKDLFGEEADLSRFFLPPDNKILYVTGAYHQAAVEVNEEGAEASAATAIVVGIKSAPKPLLFIADHPFLFAIYHTTAKALLFLGRFYDDK